MKFEIGKYYQHSGGGIINILDRVHTTFYGEGLLAENSCGDLSVVGEDETNATNWHQVSGWSKSFYESNNIPEPIEKNRTNKTDVGEEIMELIK